MTRHAWRAGTLAAALLAAPALAKGTPEDSPELQPSLGFGATGLRVSSGLTAYTGKLGGKTDIGTFFAIQAETNLLPALSVEGGYQGSANGFKEVNSGALWRHNLSATAKLGPTLAHRWKPYLGAGVGVSYIDTSGAADAQPFGNGFVGEIPLEAGVDYRFSGVTAGIRAMYHFLLGDDFSTGPYYEGNLVTGGLNLGMQF